MIKNKIPIIFSLLSILIFSGCAVNYIDDKGANHMWGISHVVTKNISRGNKDIANIYQVSSFGLYYIGMKQQSTLGIGYIRSYEISVLEDESISFSLNSNRPQDFEFKTTKTLICGGN